MGGTVQMIGHNFMEPSAAIVDVVMNILLFTKFKLICLTKNGQLPILGVDAHDIEIKGIQTLLIQTKQYLIKVLNRRETQTCLAYSAYKVQNLEDLIEAKPAEKSKHGRSKLSG
jgi:hypothetical protein